MTISLEEVRHKGSILWFHFALQEQHGEDELNDVGTNVVTLDEEVRPCEG